MLAKNTRFKTIIKLILLLFFIGHYSNITLFYHTHNIEGITYCHSHFYWLTKSSVPVQLPLHTKDQLKLIQDFNHITWNSDIDIPKIEKLFYSLIAKLQTKVITLNSLAEVLFSALRAPPTFSI